MEWPKAQLASLCEVFTDGDWIESKSQSPEGVRLIQTGNVGEGNFKDRRDKSRFISEETFDDLKCCEIFEGDCLVSRLPDPVGRSCILPKSEDRMITAVDCTILRFKKDKLAPEFFNYFSQSLLYLNTVESLTSGATRKRISRKNLGLVEIPTPPIPEQKRIVAILDQAFADIEQARAKTEQNLKNARELFESYLQQVFSLRGEGWIQKKFSECFKLRSGAGLTKKNMIEGPYPVYGGNGIAGMHKEYNLSEKSVIIGRVGAICGNARFIDENIWLTDNAFLVKDFKFEFDLEFLTYLLNHKNLRSLARQAAQPVISNSSLSDLKLDFPIEIPTQIEIRKKLELLRFETESVSNLYKKKLEHLDGLKKSILQKAFSGELTKTLDGDTNKGAAA